MPSLCLKCLPSKSVIKSGKAFHPAEKNFCTMHVFLSHLTLFSKAEKNTSDRCRCLLLCIYDHFLLILQAGRLNTPWINYNLIQQLQGHCSVNCCWIVGRCFETKCTKFFCVCDSWTVNCLQLLIFQWLLTVVLCVLLFLFLGIMKLRNVPSLFFFALNKYCTF